MSDVVINRKHYNALLADRDRLQRERDALAEALRIVHGYLKFLDLNSRAHVDTVELVEKRLAMLDDGFPP